mmetsp:Transcript_116936/g.291813  ORF Transcript_116936/g.291813 Transcript_116936/m.291813 type:complete len:351 (-) Transcript_116936:1003-2055(-)
MMVRVRVVMLVTHMVLARRLSNVLVAISGRCLDPAPRLGLLHGCGPKEAAPHGSGVDVLGLCRGSGAAHELEAGASLAEGAALPAAILERALVGLDHVVRWPTPARASVPLVPDKLTSSIVSGLRDVAVWRGGVAVEPPNAHGSVMAAGEDPAAVRGPIQGPDRAGMAQQGGHHLPLHGIRHALLPDARAAVAASCDDAVAVGGPSCHCGWRPSRHPIHVGAIVQMRNELPSIALDARRLGCRVPALSNVGGGSTRQAGVEAEGDLPLLGVAHDGLPNGEAAILAASEHTASFGGPRNSPHCLRVRPARCHHIPAQPAAAVHIGAAKLPNAGDAIIAAGEEPLTVWRPPC